MLTRYGPSEHAPERPAGSAQANEWRFAMWFVIAVLVVVLLVVVIVKMT